MNYPLVTAGRDLKRLEEPLGKIQNFRELEVFSVFWLW